MIRVERLPDAGSKEVFRFFHDDAAPAMAPYDALCGVHWLPGEMWIKGLLVRNGRVGRKWLLELLEEAERGGAEWIKSTRGFGHILPFGHEQPNGEIWINVAEVRARFPFDSRLMPLIK
ncbi:hypothetical protein RD110_18525 [Rhodoferax koreense]|uniref:Uncharacterized protein n=1 Tax=Rhodoferax koreensis TaxID=1842727 RepID=A0A1P8JYW9_9BURK|nr:hypothetical protein [Rhodoferax koreense]APW38952.1 hypothetical protein RD110_18525 [Rhodoferax koreense]